jgi:hypothetical protein
MKNMIFLIFVVVILGYCIFCNHHEINSNIENIATHEITISDSGANVKQIKKTKVGDIKGLKKKKIGGGEQTTVVSYQK